MLHWRVFDSSTPAIKASLLDNSKVKEYLDIRLNFERIANFNGERHEYFLVVEIENVGKIKLNDFRLDIRFPKAFLDIESYGFEVHKEETASHKLLRRTVSHFPEYQSGLYSGDILTDKTIRYAVNSQRYWNDDLMEMPVEVAVFADGIPSHKIKKPIRDLKNF